MFKSIAAAAIAAISFQASAAGINLVMDGSFEATTVSAGNYTTVAADSAWTSTNGIEIRNHLFGDAQDGSNFIELDTTGNSTISQTLSTVAGQWYDLTFYVEDRPQTAAATNGLTYLVGTAQPVSGEIVGGTTPTWTKESQVFQATGDRTVLSFGAGGLSDSYGSSLDDVSVVAVPEPASIALVASGLALVGLARRRQAK